MASIQLRALKIFCDVVQQRSFSRAADENEISQSGASQTVHQLEQRLGVRLIDRSKRPFILTPEGQVYYEGCRGLVERYIALEDKVRTLHREVAGRVRVASIYSVGLHHMNHFLQLFIARYPKANVRLEYLHPHRVYEAIENDKADIGLISFPRSSRAIRAIDWRTEPMVLACAPSHPLARRPRVSLEALNGQRMVCFDSDLTIRREIDRVLHQHQVDFECVMEVDNIETIKRAIEIDSGVGLLPEPTITREVEAGTLVAVPLASTDLVRPLGIIHRRGRELCSTAQRFIELLQQHDGSGDTEAPLDQATGSAGESPSSEDREEDALAGAASSGHDGASENLGSAVQQS